MDDWEELKEQCWAPNSKTAYKSRWKRYYSFCGEFGFVPLPASVMTICLYITHLTKTVSFVTIKNYVSSVWVLHDCEGVSHVDPEHFQIKSTMAGAKRVLGNATRQVDPLLPADMLQLFKALDMRVWADFVFWCALILCYRCLLRVSHVAVSPHTLRVKDLYFWPGGMDVVVHSSKTIQYKERIQRIPVWEAPGSPLCPVTALRLYVERAGLGQESFLFDFTYRKMVTSLKQLCVKARLQGDYSTHSLRRGSATYLATFLPLHEVKRYGDWKSLAVLFYISDNYRLRRTKDELVASYWRRWC